MIKKVERKSMKIRESGRSSDFISPSFGFGCLYSCAYCYMRRHTPTGLSIATNTDTILQAVESHVSVLPPKQPNQTHPIYWTYDIGCNEDFALHSKHHEWEKIFDYFKKYKMKDKVILEKDILPKISKDKKLIAYKHNGFWKCMDTLRDKIYLVNLIKKNKYPWMDFFNDK